MLVTSVPSATPAKKKHSLLPVLTVLFLISYGLMTMLIVEQGSTIESQRALIRELFRDSRELSAMKAKAIGAQTQVPQAKTNQNPSTPSAQVQSSRPQSPSTQTPSTRMPPSQTPSTQAVPQRRGPSKTKDVEKPQFAAPSRPAMDQADDRRAVNVI